MLSRDLVILELTKLAARLGRKVEAKTFDAYHSFLVMRLEDEQFARACTTITEEDDRFPTIHRLLEAARNLGRREVGEPYILGAGPLSECFSDLDAGRSYAGEDCFRGREHTSPQIERLVWNDAAYTTPQLPGEGVVARAKRIAERAEAEMGRLESASRSAKTNP